MSKPTQRFSLLLTLYILVSVALIPFSERPLIDLAVVLLHISLGAGAIAGYQGPRKVQVGLFCLGAGACVLGAVGGIIGLISAGDAMMGLLVAAAAMSFFFCLALISALTDDEFIRTTQSKAYARAMAKIA